jgi:type I restriction enzyme S subunit
LQAIAPIENPPDNLIVSTGFAVVRPIEGRLRAGFCKYALREPHFLAEVERRSVGVSYPAINSSDLAAIPIPAPPDDRQLRVEKFLDRETARLDSLVAAKQRVLNLLAEKRKAIIATAVARGLDPEVRMTPTGVEWIPDAPSHWRPSRIGRLFRQSKLLGFPDLTVLSVYREYGVIERSSRDDNANVVPDDLTKYQLVGAGDLVVNKMKAWQGSLGISELRGITSPDYVVFRPTHSEMPSYLHLMLRTPQLTTVYLSNSNGIRINQWRIEPERFLNIPVLLPPTAEQRVIVEHIAHETAKLDGMRAATERTIALLRERRAALIAAAVTGQLDVGTTA